MPDIVLKMKASSLKVPGIEYKQTLEGISEYVLTKNGLRILLVPDSATSVAGCMVTYHVGSRNEATGYTGATHLLEHLMFKGSKKFIKNKGTGMDALLENRGALLNATTWFDRTNYYEVVPSESLSLAIEIEGDRMRTATFTKKDKEDEMPVVRNEFERGENHPMEALDKAVWQAAFVAHPYHHSTIGWRSDIENVSIERLREFYNDFYWPNNATVTIAGNFDTKKTLELIKKYFGIHTKSPKPFPPLYTQEPKQEGERRVLVKRVGTDMICVAHKIPNAHHADMPALVMLASIMSEDKTSRLYKTFVDKALATNVTVYPYQLHDDALFLTFITLTEKLAHEKAEKLLKEEYSKIATTGVSALEIKQAKILARSSTAERRDGAYALLSSLNEEIATGDWKRFISFPKAYQKVTSKDIMHVAKKYFLDDMSTIGYFKNTPS